MNNFGSLQTLKIEENLFTKIRKFSENAQHIAIRCFFQNTCMLAFNSLGPVATSAALASCCEAASLCRARCASSAGGNCIALLMLWFSPFFRFLAPLARGHLPRQEKEGLAGADRSPCRPGSCRVASRQRASERSQTAATDCSTRPKFRMQCHKLLRRGL